MPTSMQFTVRNGRVTGTLERMQREFSEADLTSMFLAYTRAMHPLAAVRRGKPLHAKLAAYDALLKANRHTLTVLGVPWIVQNNPYTRCPINAWMAGYETSPYRVQESGMMEAAKPWLVERFNSEKAQIRYCCPYDTLTRSYVSLEAALAAAVRLHRLDNRQAPDIMAA